MNQSTSTSTFQVGETVELRSGGPELTVIEIDTNRDLVWCKYWDSKSSRFRKESFPPNALQPPRDIAI